MGRRCCCGDYEDCEYCKDSKAPKYIKLVISGMADKTCANCNSINGTFILELTSNPAAICYYTHQIASICQDSPSIDLFQLSIPSSGIVTLQITIRTAFVNQVLFYQFSLDSPPKCLEIDEEVGLSSEEPPLGAFNPCDPASSTARIVSL